MVAYTQTVTDPLGIHDSSSKATTRSVSDAEGIFSSGSPSTTKLTSDQIGLLDSKTHALGHFVIDAAGSLDSLGGSNAFAGTIAVVSDLPPAAFGIPLAFASWTAEKTQGFAVSCDFFGSISLPQVPAPFPSPGAWYAASTASITAGATTIPVLSLEVNMPTGAVLFFPSSTVILTRAANLRDTTLHVRPVHGYVDSGHVGDGWGPPPAAPGPGQPPAARQRDAWDGFTPLRRTSLRYPKPILDDDGLPT